jgi:hypothetical protein
MVFELEGRGGQGRQADRYNSDRQPENDCAVGHIRTPSRTDSDKAHWQPAQLIAPPFSSKFADKDACLFLKLEGEQRHPIYF